MEARPNVGSRLAATRALPWFAGPALAFGAAEATVRLVDLGTLAAPEIQDEKRRTVGDLAEITGFFGNEDAPSRGDSLTQVQAATRGYGWYDRPRWNYFDAVGCVEYRFNSLGFRDEEFPLRKPADELRLLALGDSFTFACGVRVEDCWVQRLEQKLEQSRGAPVEVVNAGFSFGHRPASYATWLEERGFALEPDAVVLGFCLNDVSESIPMYLPLESTLRPWLGGRSRLLVELQRRIAPPAPIAATPIRAERVTSRHADEWRSTQDGLRALRDLTQARGLRFVVVVFPMFSQLRHDYLFSEIHALVRDFCAAERIECLDLLPTFLGQDERELWVHPTDQHANVSGQEQIAAALAAHFAAHPLALAPR